MRKNEEDRDTRGGGGGGVALLIAPAATPAPAQRKREKKKEEVAVLAPAPSPAVETPPVQKRDISDLLRATVTTRTEEEGTLAVPSQEQQQPVQTSGAGAVGHRQVRAGVIRSTLVHETLESFWRNRDMYMLPPNQRGDNATSTDYRLFMLSLLLGNSIDNIKVVRVVDPNSGREKRIIIGGGHRERFMHAIFEGRVKSPDDAFLEHFLPNSGIPLVDPGCSMPPPNGKRGSGKQLSPESQRWLASYTFGVDILENVQPEWFGDLWLLANRHQNITLGNELNSKMSLTARVARQLRDWGSYEWWWQLYHSSKRLVDDVKDIRLASVITMLMFENTYGTDWHYLAVHKPDLMKWSSGLYDGLVATKDEATGTLVPTVLVERLVARMARIARVFYGLNATSRTAIIAMYQASLFLEDQHGYDFSLSELVRRPTGVAGAGGEREAGVREQGVLVDWLVGLRSPRKWGGVHSSAINIVSHMNQWQPQRNMWENQLPWLLEHASEIGLVKKEQ